MVCVCVCVCVCHLCTRPGNARLSQHAAFLSAFRFNPSWIEANAEGTVPAGLIVRTQNCTVGYPPNGCGLLGPDGKHTCCECNMRSANASLQERSILTFTAVGAGGDGSAVGHPKFAALTKDSVVFEPIDKPPLNDDFRGKSRASSPSSVRRPIRTRTCTAHSNPTTCAPCTMQCPPFATGTEDPRVAYDRSSSTYYMFYTCFKKYVSGGTLCLVRDRCSAMSAAAPCVSKRARDIEWLEPSNF